MLLGRRHLVTQGFQLSTPKVLEPGQQGQLFALSHAIHTCVFPGRLLCKGPALTCTFCVGQKDTSSLIRGVSQWLWLLLGLPACNGGSRYGRHGSQLPSIACCGSQQCFLLPTSPSAAPKRRSPHAVHGLPFPPPHMTSSAGFCFKGREKELSTK